MAKLEGIYISGIRSYGIEKHDAQSLKFHSPVTLFLGQNGCGKTTIIECVKHALTGDFPFSTKSGGQSFVADPLLYNLQSTKGCIKLKFSDVYGNPALISRVLKLDINNGKPRCTSQDASYTYTDRQGDEHTLSVKLADCKNMIKMLVGVSEAVLNNVLFCHQEDSLWPLGEDGLVKKKFDQIFDSSQFDTTVDTLTKLVKEQQNNLKNLNKELVFLKEIRETAKLKHTALKDKEETLKLLNKESESLREKRVPLKDQLNEVIALEESLSKLKRIMSEKENQLKTNRDYQFDLRGLLKSEFQGTDEDLEHEIANFQQRCVQKQNELAQVRNQITAIQRDIAKNGDEVQKKTSALATVREQINGFNAKIKERDNCISSLLREYKCEADGSFDGDYRKMNSCLKSESDDLSENIKELRSFEKSIEDEVEAAQNKLMEVKSRETVRQKEKDAAMEEKRDVDAQLADLSSSEEEFLKFEQKIRKLQNEIDNILSSFNEDAASSTIDKNKRTIRRLNENLEEFDGEMKVFAHNELIEHQMEIHQSDKANKEKQIRTLKHKHHNDLKSLFGDDMVSEKLRQAVKNIQEKQVKILQTHKRDLVQKERQSSDLNARLSVQKSELASVKKEVTNGRQSIEKFCKMDEFEAKMKEVTEDIRLLNEEKGQLRAYRILYKDFVKDFNEKKCCPVCTTNFSAKQDKLKQLTTKMSEKVLRVPERISEVTTRLEKSQQLLSNLTELNPVFSKMTRLEIDLQEKEALVATAESKYAEARDAVKSLRSEIDKAQGVIDVCAELAPGVAMIDQYNADIANAVEKITELQARLQPVPSNRTKADTQTVIDNTKDEIAQLEHENERLSMKIAANQKRLHECRTQKTEVTEKQNKLQRAVHDKPQLIIKQVELQKKIDNLNNLLEAAEDDCFVAQSEVEETKMKLAGAKNANAKTLEEMRTKLQNHRSALNNIDRLQETIKKIQQMGLEQKCKTIEDQIAEIKDARSALEKDLIELNQKQDKFKEELHDQDSADKSLQNNKKLRDLVKKESQLKSSIDILSEQIADKTYDNIEEEKHKLQRELSTIVTDLANIEGQITSLTVTIKDLKKEVTSYKNDPIKEYNKRVVQIACIEMEIKELQSLTKLVSNGICKYHQEQLHSINLRLRDMWRSIYKGNDIDYIQVESGETQITGGAGIRRQYSYRLMQKKGDVVVPMRGKVSAGQKVLACLLLRIVLSEHFSADCGIFALDEPTTNLDRENIRSLSAAIAKLINSHSSERNFQFLIITHDEEFLDALREADTLKDFYRVERNNRGNTVILSERI